jgi:hypothetical protein
MVCDPTSSASTFSVYHKSPEEGLEAGEPDLNVILKITTSKK